MKRIYYILLLSVILFSCEKTISPFQSQNFIKYFGTGYESKGYDIIQHADGGYVFTGYDKNSQGNYQVFGAKVDKNGNTVWSKTWGDPTNREEGKIIKEVSDGFFIAGTTLKSSGFTHSFLMKINYYGDSLWYKEYGGVDTSLIVNDILLGDNKVYIIGKSYTISQANSDFFFKEIDYNGNGDATKERTSWSGTGSFYNKGFLQADNLLFAGTLGITNKVVLVPINKSTLNGDSFIDDVLGDNNITSDAIFSNDELYLLVNSITAINKNLKVLKLNSSFDRNWKTDSIPSTEGKSFTLKEDGSLLVCGEKIVGTESRIYFVKIDDKGEVYHGDELFRTFSGYVGKVIETNDKGVIIVGTSLTNGTMIQLIKTDRDLFLLKP